MDIDKASKICQDLEDSTNEMLQTIGERFGTRIRYCIATFIQLDNFIKSMSATAVDTMRRGITEPTGNFDKYVSHTHDAALRLLKESIRDDFIKLSADEKNALSSILANMMNRNSRVSRQTLD